MTVGTMEYADFTQKDKIYKTFLDFSGGQNDTSPPDNVADNEVEKLINFDIIARGGLMSRPGTVEVPVFSPDTHKIDRVIELQKFDGTIKKLALSNGNLYDWSDGSLKYASIGDSIDYTQFQDKVYMVGGGEMYVYDGTSVTIVTNTQPDSNLHIVKKCKYIEKRGERLFLTGNPDYPSDLYYSQIVDPTYFKGTDFKIRAMSDDGDFNTGLKEYHGALLVFKTKYVYAWFGNNPTTDVTFVKLNVATGTKAYRTICNVENYLFYLGNDGVYALLGTYQDVIVTRKISRFNNNTFKKLQNSTSYYKNTPCAIYKDGKYMISFCTNSIAPDVNDTIGVFFNELWQSDNQNSQEPWSFYEGLNISEMLYSKDGTLYLMSSKNNKVFKFDDDSTDDCGTPIHYHIDFKEYHLGAPFHLKKIKNGWLLIRQFESQSSIVEFSAKIDYQTIYSLEIDGDESMVYGEGEWGTDKWGWVNTVTKPFKINRRGKRIQISIDSSISNNKILIYGLGFEFKLKKPSRE